MNDQTDLEPDIEIYTGGMFQTNGYRLRWKGLSIVIDAPEGIAAWLAERGETIDGLILTHLHHDHVLDVAALKREFGCPVYAHSRKDPGLTLESLLRSEMGMVPIPEIEDFAVDHLLEGESKLVWGGEPGQEGSVEFDLLHVPGHSPDSICVSPAGTGILFGGDVLFQGGIGRTDFPHGDHELLLRGIREKVFALPDQTEVLPGHGPPTTVGLEKATNPFLRPI